ncbi:hypothetical protein [Pseudoduganella violacea]|uniref:Uncharacterized protein n=1 Tax=Pseudoduganella violacea TaxID=1715466 RepID=A0A7W5BA69_9BURK|nr:hypothetical protein [Pseudoduganella violacea]MBB3118680.1 hypothetical protein [Pseudoduganella violacea]
MKPEIHKGWQDFRDGFRQGMAEGWHENVRIYFLPITVPYHFCRIRLRLLRRRLRRALSA